MTCPPTSDGVRMPEWSNWAPTTQSAGSDHEDMKGHFILGERELVRKVAPIHRQSSGTWLLKKSWDSLLLSAELGGVLVGGEAINLREHSGAVTALPGGEWLEGHAWPIWIWVVFSC